MSLMSPSHDERLTTNVVPDSDNLMLLSDRALALMLDCNLTKEAYQRIRLHNKEFGDAKSSAFPAYNHVRDAKDRCMPPIESFNV